jgi:putative transposase
MLRDLLRREGVEIGRQHVGTLMKKMAIEAIYRRPNTSKPAPRPKIYPYLLYKLPIVRPNWVWASDISYIPMAKGFVYRVAIVDWFSPQGSGLAGIDHDGGQFLCRRTEKALARFGKPEIFNKDQGSQFTSMAFTSVLLREKIAISMDGRGAWRDNVIVERLWRSVTYEEDYLRAYSAVRSPIVDRSLSEPGRRPHSSLAARTPIRSILITCR